MSLRQEFKSFISNVESNIVEAQQDVAHTVMDELFTHSPHYDPIKGHLVKMGKHRTSVAFARSEYDANHKVSSKNQKASNHNEPTYNEGLSKAINNEEANKINEVSDIGDTISITNDTAHAYEVETGLGWSRIGYSTFHKAAYAARKKHAGVLT
jgi:hypothetical protein